MNFAKKLNYLLTVKNLTQKELADKINKQHQIVSRWLNGIEPSKKSVAQVAKALNVPVDELLDDSKTITETPKKDLKDKEIELLKKEVELLKKELALKEELKKIYKEIKK